MRTLCLLVIAFAVAAPSFATGTAGDVREASAGLVRPESPPQSEARGAVAIRDGSDYQMIKIVVEGVKAEVGLLVLLGDGGENLKVVGEMPKGTTAKKFLRTTQEGGELPFGVEEVSDLSGRRIRIVDGDERVVLTGEVPHFKSEEPKPEPKPDPKPEPKPDPKPDPKKEPVTARSYFQRTDYAGEREPRGVIVAIRRAESSALKMEFAKLASSTDYDLIMGTEGDMEFVDDFRTNGEGGAWFLRDTAEGQDLPLGASTVGDLAEKRVEVRDGEGHTILYGAVPYADKPEDTDAVKREDEVRDTETGAAVTIRFEIDPKRGDERMHLSMRDLPKDRAPAKARGARPLAVVFIADGDDALEPVESVPVSRSGRARWRVFTRRGDALPLGAASLRELSGRAFEVRIGGTRVASGNLPDLD